MKRQEFLKAFAEMSPEDQQSIRTELLGKSAADPMAMCQGMMDKMKAGGNPMAIFQEMTEKMKEKCC